MWATMHVYGLSTSLTRTHLLLAGNDTVPISIWHGDRMRFYPVPSSFSTVFYVDVVYLSFVFSFQQFPVQMQTKSRT